MIHHVFWIKRGQFIFVFQRNGPGRTRGLAIATEDAAQQIDVKDFSVALAGGDAVFLGIFLGLDIDGIGWASPGAEEAANTAFQAILIAMQHVPPTKTRR